MLNFTFKNPTEILFGKGMIAEITTRVPQQAPVLLAYGGGSIKRNGVYDQVCRALPNHRLVEFAGIEANPQYETCLRAVEVVKREQIGFILAVGGGSVSGRVQVHCCRVRLSGPGSLGDPAHGRRERAGRSARGHGAHAARHRVRVQRRFRDLAEGDAGEAVLPFPPFLPRVFRAGPGNDVHSAAETGPERNCRCVRPRVRAVHDLSVRLATAGSAGRVGTADAGGGRTCRRWPNRRTTMREPDFMWSATLALNNLIGCGVPQDWASHMIGHELTAYYGLDHAETLAMVLLGRLATRAEAEASEARAVRPTRLECGHGRGSDREDRGVLSRDGHADAAEPTIASPRRMRRRRCAAVQPSVRLPMASMAISGRRMLTPCSLCVPEDVREVSFLPRYDRIHLGSPGAPCEPIVLRVAVERVEPRRARRLRKGPRYSCGSKSGFGCVSCTCMEIAGEPVATAARCTRSGSRSARLSASLRPGPD